MSMLVLRLHLFGRMIKKSPMLNGDFLCSGTKQPLKIQHGKYLPEESTLDREIELRV